MDFNLSKSIEILERTPDVLITLLQDVSTDWTSSTEGSQTWSAYDIIGHLIEGEKTDWIPRMEIILSDAINKTFQPFDRFAQLKESKDRTLAQLLKEFKELRQKNLKILRSKKSISAYENRKSIHPTLGEVTLSQLLATWVVHDLNHINQITRVMAKQYKSEVGPWVEYLRILQS